MLRNLIAGFLSFIFVVTATPSFFAFGFYKTFSDKDFYSEEFSEVVYEAIANQLPKFFNYEDFKALTENDVEDLFRKIITKDDLHLVITELVQEFGEAKVKQDHTIEMNISLDWLADKEDILAREFTELLYKRLPKCAQSKVDAKNEGFNCVPSDIAKIDFQQQIQRNLENGFFAKLPKEYSFFVNVPEKFEGNLKDFFEKIFQTALITISFFLLIILILIALVTFSPPWKILKWETKTIFSATLILSISTVFLLFSPEIVLKIYDKFALPIPRDEILAYEKVWEFFSQAVAFNILKYSLPIAIVSLVLYFYARIKLKKVSIQK